MLLKTLKVQHFKNYSEQQIDFSGGINCILGKNGMGKTNLLDAIHYLSMTKSAMIGTDLQNVKIGQEFFAINGVFQHKKKELKVNTYYDSEKKKMMKMDGIEPEKLSEHIGKIPSVLTTPDDSEIIKEGSEIRRKLFDSIISQFDKEYLRNLIDLHRVLKQRNSFLKQNEGRKNVDRTLLAVYDEKILPLNEKISEVRKLFIDVFKVFFNENYQMIFRGNESPDITYRSDCLEKNYRDNYINAFEKDIILQRTSIGCHKDDYIFQLNEKPIKKFGSQGQQKSFIIALKLALFDFLKSKKGYSPILLLDDLFDKLDDDRIVHLVTLLSDSKRFPQLFITDAREERSREFFKGVKKVKFFTVRNGQIK